MLTIITSRFCSIPWLSMLLDTLRMVVNGADSRLRSLEKIPYCMMLQDSVERRYQMNRFQDS